MAVSHSRRFPHDDLANPICDNRRLLHGSLDGARRTTVVVTSRAAQEEQPRPTATGRQRGMAMPNT